MPLLSKFIYPSGHSVSFLHTRWLVCNLFSLFISEMISLSLCSSFNKRTLQTSVGSSAYPITHLSTTPVLFSLSPITLLCILDETRKLRLHLSISHPTIVDLITQFLSFRPFILLLFSCSLPKACNYRLCCKTWVWASIFQPFPDHSFISHTQSAVDSCRDLENTWSSNMCKAATSVWAHKCNIIGCESMWMLNPTCLSSPDYLPLLSFPHFISQCSFAS